jgi:hypothetical protein
VGGGIAGGAALFASSLYGPITQSAPLLHPLVLATLAAEVLLVLTLLRFGQIAFMPKAAAA